MLGCVLSLSWLELFTSTLVSGASGNRLLLVVAVLASGKHLKSQPSFDVTNCGLGTWRIDTVPSIGQPDISNILTDDRGAQ